jgi:hypothetical protein
MQQTRIVSSGVLAVATAGVGLWLTIGGSAQVASTPQRSTPTFSHDVAPILYAKCVSCHRPGEVGPMPLITFKDVRPWARAIQQKTSTRAMPPWGADEHYGKFRNDRSLTDRQLATLAAWADGGAPEGDTRDLPALPQFVDGWQIGQPDQTFEMRADFEIPAKGAVDYQYFEVPTNFTEDHWMQAGEVRAGDRAHVHHIIVYVKEPKPTPRPVAVTIRPILAAPPAVGRNSSAPPSPTPTPAAALASSSDVGRPSAADVGLALSGPPVTTAPAQTTAASSRTGDTMLVNWAVGEDAPVFPSGMAKRIPAGSTLVFQVHYTTNGTSGRDRSRVGFIFSKEPPQREMRTALIANPVFTIPAGAGNHQVEAEATFVEDVKIYTMHPHMHLRGKDMTYTLTRPDGATEVLLSVPKYDFGWQTDYALAEPLAVTKGSKVRVTAHFDNSPANRANPDPTANVRWGDQTWEEMMIGFVTYTVEGRAASQTASR